MADATPPLPGCGRRLERQWLFRPYLAEGAAVKPKDDEKLWLLTAHEAKGTWHPTEAGYPDRRWIELAVVSTS